MESKSRVAASASTLSAVGPSQAGSPVVLAEASVAVTTPEGLCRDHKWAAGVHLPDPEASIAAAVSKEAEAAFLADGEASAETSAVVVVVADSVEIAVGMEEAVAAESATRATASSLADHPTVPHLVHAAEVEAVGSKAAQVGMGATAPTTTGVAAAAVATAVVATASLLGSADLEAEAIATATVTVGTEVAVTTASVGTTMTDTMRTGTREGTDRLFETNPGLACIHQAFFLFQVGG
jgi:hypothetical protein